MKVILVNAYCPPYAPGGAEFSMIALAEHMAGRGISVTIITPNYGQPPQVPDNVQIVTISSPFDLPIGQSIDVGIWLVTEEFKKTMAGAIIHAWSPGDVIHLQNMTVVEAGLQAQAYGCGPLIATIRDTTPLCLCGWCMMSSSETPPRCCQTWMDQIFCAWQYSTHQIVPASLLRRLYQQPRYWTQWRKTQKLRRQLAKLDHLITVSHGFRALLLKNGVGTPKTLTAVYNMPSPDQTMPTEDFVAHWRSVLQLSVGAQVILFVGKRSLGKGVPYLLRAMEHVNHRHPNAVLVMVGKGPVPVPTPYLRVHGPVSQQDLAAFYSLATVVVIPSIWPEPFSRVLLESMMFNRPVIATDVGGSSEGVIDGQNGWIVPPRDAAKLSGAISEALEHSDDLSRMGKNGQALLGNRFSAGRSLAQLEDIYRQVRRS